MRLIHFSQNNPSDVRRDKVPPGAHGKQRGRRWARDLCARRKSTKKFRCEVSCFLALEFQATRGCPSLFRRLAQRLASDQRALRVRDRGKTQRCPEAAIKRTKMPKPKRTQKSL